MLASPRMSISGGASGGVLAPIPLPWLSTDPRGNAVLLTQEAWDHAAAHHQDFCNGSLSLPPDPFGPISRGLSDPDRILDNSQRRGLPPRVGKERYYRQDGYCDPPHVVVVVRVLDVDQIVEGIQVPAGARVVHTFYVSKSPPVGATIWRR